MDLRLLEAVLWFLGATDVGHKVSDEEPERGGSGMTPMNYGPDGDDAGFAEGREATSAVDYMPRDSAAAGMQGRYCFSTFRFSLESVPFLHTGRHWRREKDARFRKQLF